MSSEALYSTARESVVAVGGILECRHHPEGHSSFATGFVVHPDGIVVTNQHVVTAFENNDAIGVMTNDGRVFPVLEVLAADPLNDIAALKIDARDLSPLPITGDIDVGAEIHCLSHPALGCSGGENGFYTFTRGMVSGKFRLSLSARAPVDVLAITADYAKGSSGGPILNRYGAVVGIVCETKSICHDPSANDVHMTWKLGRPSKGILALLSGVDLAAQENK